MKIKVWTIMCKVTTAELRYPVSSDIEEPEWVQEEQTFVLGSWLSKKRALYWLKEIKDKAFSEFNEHSDEYVLLDATDIEQSKYGGSGYTFSYESETADATERGRVEYELDWSNILLFV